MSTHYRSPVNYSISQLEIASDSVYYIYQTLYDCEEALSLFKDRFPEESNPKVEKLTSETQDCIKKLRSDFQIKMSDDLHATEILNSTLQETFRLINKSLESLKKKKQQQRALFHSLGAIEREVNVILDVLGLCHHQLIWKYMQFCIFFYSLAKFCFFLTSHLIGFAATERQGIEKSRVSSGYCFDELGNGNNLETVYLRSRSNLWPHTGLCFKEDMKKP
ncbi:hypothetical protein Sjap_002741 [Stephania japonica]|uniref:Uncharacterized protein n=1 Tax=Stephania japonica TaxID=461633 RepID=A0AAP0PWE4_9MAGN